MAIDWTTTRAALHAWMVAGTGLPAGRVIWANQAAPRPQTPFAEINPRMSIRRLGAYDEERPTATPGTIARVTHLRLGVSCHLYGAGAMDLMERAREYLDTHAARALFEPAGLSVLDRGEVRDITKLLETQYEERAQLDLVIGLATTATEDVGFIQTVDLTTTVRSPDGSTAAIVTQTITGT